MTYRFTLIWDNFADRASLSGGDWVMPLSNLQQDDIGIIARSRSQLESATRFEANLGVARPVGGFALGPTTLSPGATLVVQAIRFVEGEEELVAEAEFTLPGSRVPSMTLPWRSPGWWFGRPDDVEVQERVYAFGIFPEPIQAPLWRFQIRDEQNPAGYVDIGRLYLGRTFTPGYNYDQGGNITSFLALTDTQESLGGAEYFWRRAQRRVFRCTFSAMREAELFGPLSRIMRQAGVDGQVFLIPNPDDALHAQTRSFLARFAAIPAIEQTFFEHGTTGLDFREVL